MVVEFEFKRAGGFQAIVARWSGPWNEKRIHTQFLQLEAWAKERNLRTKRWIFQSSAERHWLVGIEVTGKVRGAKGVHVQAFPSGRVARVTFDPDVVSPMVVYHGLADWLRWRRKDKQIRWSGAYREVYESDPWKSARASAHTTLQVPVRP